MYRTATIPYPAVMTLQQAASYLHMHPRTLRRWANDGDVPASRMGHRWRFMKDSLDAWLLQKQTGAVEVTA